MGFQQIPPQGSKGSGHVLFLNAFNDGSLPASLYWSDLALQLSELLSKGHFSETLHIHPIPGSLIDGSVQHQGSGVFGLVLTGHTSLGSTCGYCRLWPSPVQQPLPVLSLFQAL